MDDPYPVLEVQLGAWPGSQWASFHPKHYLKKWHINHNPDANKVAKEEGFDDWTRAFHYHFWWSPKKDIEQPTMMPWRFTSFTTSVRTYERNPYYFQVDAEGNQLPYIDTIVSTLVDRETYQLKAISGEADIAFRRTSVDNWSLYKQNESAGGYVVYGAPGVLSADVGLALNQNHEDPDLRKLFQDIRFRRALSVAIDRDDLNKSVYLGLGTPLQATMLPSTTFYKEEWGQAHAEFDPDEANRLLDEVGLSERDRDGFRIGPDGDALLITVEWSATLSVPPAAFELIKEYLGRRWRQGGAAPHGERAVLGNGARAPITRSGPARWKPWKRWRSTWSRTAPKSAAWAFRGRRRGSCGCMPRPMSTPARRHWPTSPTASCPARNHRRR